ncbi:MAG: YqiA/YcfP family alpha/beta fold hydrolase [Hyphomicrobiales bacterium]|jgi:alpha-beta hydrolase superfamily lysophospholipase|nr:YqiA/YcfP family alpha/beta fold hydrolase [Hyphomicrobiales bacterium]|tara:strand:- start:1377 stop:2549 length:1173 start_codon:yes stop_codon:yes gene_type:complete
MGKLNSWTDSFPGNFQWSNATLVCKGMAPYGVVSINDIEEVVSELNSIEMNLENWIDIWCKYAKINQKKAEVELQKGNKYTSGLYFLRAGNYYYSSERFINPGDEKLKISKLAFSNFNNGFKNAYPHIKRLEIPYEDSCLPGLFIPSNQKNCKSPTIVIFNGMDNCKEMSALFAGIEFSKRGFNTFAVDGPGQGESLRLLNIKARYDYEVPASIIFDYLSEITEVDKEKIIIMGYSFGGYYASRIAAHDNRYAAGIALTSGHWDLYEFQKSIIEKLKTSSNTTAQSNFQFQWVVGAKNTNEALEISKKFSVKDNAQKIKIPFLITHGENDRIIPVKNAYKFYDNLPSSTQKKLKVFTKDDGASEHAHVDDRQKGINYVADWLKNLLNVEF